MSYVSLLKNIPEIISQPIGIAAIASLGIHGAIAMLVPLMPMDSSKPKETASKTVGLVELSQADQNRLPQTTPQIGLQQLPPIASLSPQNFSAQTLLPPVAPPPSGQFVLPPLPPSSSNYRISSLPTRQSLRMIPSSNLRFDAPKLDGSSRFNSSAKFSRTVPRLNESNGKYGTIRLPIQGNLPDLQAQTMSDDLLRTQSQNLSDNTSIATAQRNLTEEMTQPGNQGYKITENSLINSLKQAGRNGNTLIGTRASALNTPNLSVRGTQQSIAQLDSYDVLRKEVQQQYPNAEQKPVIRETVSTDKPNLEGAALGVLVVDADGKVLDIKFEDKVSPELRTKAREYFSKQSPKGDQKISSYPFSLRFQNNSSNTTGATPGLKPLPLLTPTPGVNGNQLIPSPATTSTPLSKAPIRNNQPTSSPRGTLKPLVTPGVNSNQPASSPAGSLKPLSEVQIRNNQPTPSSAANTSESSVPIVNTNQSTPTPESEQELLQQLRELKEKRQQKSNPEK